MANKIEATQGVVLAVLRSMGRQCPPGREPDFLAGLDRFYANIHREPLGKQAVLDGLAARQTVRRREA